MGKLYEKKWFVIQMVRRSFAITILICSLIKVIFLICSPKMSHFYKMVCNPNG